MLHTILRRSLSRAGAWILASAVALAFAGKASGQNVPPGIDANGPRQEFQAGLTAAKHGSVQAQLKVAKAYYTGRGTRRDYKAAFQWFETAAPNSTEANAWLGSCYIFGRGVAEDLNRGVTLIRKAAEANDPVGLRFMGTLYERGRGVPQSYSSAMQFYTKAAASKDARSLQQLGVMYLRGLGVDKDPQRAKALFEQGAQLGDDWAQLELGDLLSESAIPNVPHDYAGAAQLYEASASQGNRIAAFKMAKMLENGRGTVPDRAKAFQYYRESARRGYIPAQIALAEMHEAQGEPMNLVYAYVWYSLAADQGDALANQRVTALAGKLEPDQINQAQTILSSWKRTLSNQD